MTSHGHVYAKYFNKVVKLPGTMVFVSGVVERRPAPRCGFRGDCCPPTVLHRLCRQRNDKLSRPYLQTLVAIRQYTLKEENTVNYEKAVTGDNAR